MTADGSLATVLAAGAAGWEPTAVEALSAPGARLVLVKRCLDLADLLATAATGTVQVAVVSDELPGLDADSVDRLARHGVRTVAVTRPGAGRRRPEDDDLGSRTRLLRLGVARVLDEGSLPDLAEHVRDAARQDVRAPLGDDPVDSESVVALVEEETRTGTMVAVWGPSGAPGRTTVAIGLAAEAARRGHRVTLVDADPSGGAVAQHLAVLDEVSGLLAAARLANAGRLDRVTLAALSREVGPRLRVVTGLPRPDRWADVRAQAFGRILAAARELDDLVVVDAGSGLAAPSDDPFSTAPGRDDLTLAAIADADRVVAVGSADPLGLTRLARSLPEVREHRTGGDVHVTVNRMRSTLGWSEKEIRYLVGGVAPQASVTFLPDDRAAADRALVSGRALTECGDSPLRRAVAGLADVLLVDLLSAPLDSARVARRSLLGATRLRR